VFRTGHEKQISKIAAITEKKQSYFTLSSNIRKILFIVFCKIYFIIYSFSLRAV